LSTLLVIKDMGRVPKRLKTGDKPVVAAVKVKVGSDNDVKEEDESSDNDNNEEEEDKGQEGQVAQPVAQVEWPWLCTTKTKVHPDGLQQEYGGWSDS
jgi:hypothetical protein